MLRVAAILMLQASLQGPEKTTVRTDPAPAAVTATSAVAVRALRPPVIDGKDDDAVWAGAPVISDFREWQPTEGKAPRFRTEAKVAFDAANLYVFVRCFDPHPDSIIRILERRDTFTPSDMVWLFIDSYHDRRTGYEFGVNAAGVKIDQAISNGNNEDGAWDGVWDVATRIDSLGWTAEYRIPLSQLRFGTARDHTFGFTIDRDIYRFNERVSWPQFSQAKPDMVSQFGTPDRAGRPAGAAPARAGAVPGDQGRVGHHQQRLRPRVPRHHRRRPQVPRGLEPHARRHDQPGLRPGGGRSGGAEPLGVRVVLRRAAAVLRGGPRVVPVQRQLQLGQLRQRGAVLQPPHRAHAAADLQRHDAAATDDDPRAPPSSPAGCRAA